LIVSTSSFPNSRLGTPVAKLLFRVREERNRVSMEDVPKQEFGNEVNCEDSLS